MAANMLYIYVLLYFSKSEWSAEIFTCHNMLWVDVYFQLGFFKNASSFAAFDTTLSWAVGLLANSWHALNCNHIPAWVEAVSNQLDYLEQFLAFTIANAS